MCKAVAQAKSRRPMRVEHAMGAMCVAWALACALARAYCALSLLAAHVVGVLHVPRLPPSSCVPASPRRGLAGNPLSGAIPTQLGQLIQLRVLYAARHATLGSPPLYPCVRSVCLARATYVLPCHAVAA